MVDHFPDLRVYHDDLLHDHDDTADELLGISEGILVGRTRAAGFRLGIGHPQ